MNASTYQKEASRTLIDRPGFEIVPRSWVIILNALALARAAGSVVELVKKGIFHQHDLTDYAILQPLREVKVIAGSFFGRENSFAWWRITERETMIIWNLVGLVGEASELADLILKSLGQAEIDQKAVTKELGDCLWYIAALCTKYNMDMGEVMEVNIAKLKERYPAGFSSEDSRTRVDERI